MDGWTTDARVTTVALLCSSISRAKKSKLQNFVKQKKWSGDMVKGTFPPQFGIKVLDGF